MRQTERPRCLPSARYRQLIPPTCGKQTDSLIESTEKALNGINRKLNDQEQKTAAQIREFLKQAREAVTAGDMDGAHHLATKAKVLLDELHP